MLNPVASTTLTYSSSSTRDGSAPGTSAPPSIAPSIPPSMPPSRIPQLTAPPSTDPVHPASRASVPHPGGASHGVQNEAHRSSSRSSSAGPPTGRCTSDELHAPSNGGK